MDVIWAQELVDEAGVAGKVWSANGGEASRFKSTPIAPQPPEDERSNGRERHRATVHRSKSGGGRAAWVRPVGPTPRSVGPELLAGALTPFVVHSSWGNLSRERKGRKEKRREGF